MQKSSLLQASRWGAAVLLAVVVGLYLYAHHAYYGALTAALVALPFWLKCRKHLNRAGMQGVGAKSERLVARTLKRSDAYYVLNNATIPGAPGGDADHTFLCPRGIAIIETKSGGGRIRLTRDGRITTGKGRTIPGDAIAQVLAQASALSRMTGLPVTPVVCIPYMSNRSFHARGVTVCSARALRGVMAAMGGTLTEAQAVRWARQLRC